MKLKLLLVFVLDENDDNYTPPLGLGSIASYIKEYSKKEVDIKIITNNYKKNIDIFEPDIVGISSITKNYEIAKKVSAYCRNKGIYNIIGGVHITALPGSFDKSMNLGVIGEGESTFLDILNYFDGKEVNQKDLKKIQGIIYWKNNEIITNKRRKLIKNLDDIPPPAKELINIKRNSNAPIISSRGCPYRCVFCSNPLFWSRTVRMHSAEYVINEIKELIERYNPKYIQFWDDLFILNIKRLREIADFIRKNRINKKVGFIISARANLITEEVARLLKEMNVIEVAIGFESGSEEILKYLKQGTTTVNDNYNAIKIIKKYKINVTGFFIIGAPMDTKKTIRQTLNFIKKNPIDTVNLFILTPYPGTPLWDYALNKRLVSNDMNWTALNRTYDPSRPEEVISVCENLTKKEIAGFYKEFLRYNRIKKGKQLLKNAFLHPGRIIPFLLDKIQKK